MKRCKYWDMKDDKSKLIEQLEKKIKDVRLDDSKKKAFERKLADLQKDSVKK